MKERFILDQKAILVVAAIVLVTFMINVNYTAINLALVPIGKELGVVLDILQWVMSAYLLVWGAFSIPGARLCEVFGKRKSFMTGVSLFFIGSVISGFSQGIYILIFGRILMGIGAAVFTPSSYALIYSFVPSHYYGRVLGIISATVAFGLVAGSAWGAYIIQAYSWHWIFYANIPIIVFVLDIFMVAIQLEPPPEQVKRGDWLGMFMLGIGIIFAAIFVNLISSWGYTDWQVWLCAILSIVLLTSFWFRDRKTSNQTLPRALLKNKTYLATLKVSFIGSYLFSLIFITLNLFLQTIQNYTPKEAGLFFIALTVIDGVAGILTGIWIDRIGVKTPFLLGIAVSFLGFILVTFMTPLSPIGFILLGLFFLGAGMGILWPPIYGSMFKSVDKEQISTASSLFTMAEILGEACGFVVVTTCLMLASSFKLKAILVELGIILQDNQLTAAYNLLGQLERTPSDFALFPENKLTHIQEALQKAFMSGFSFNMIIALVLCTIMLYFVVRYSPKQRRQLKK